MTREATPETKLQTESRRALAHLTSHTLAETIARSEVLRLISYVAIYSTMDRTSGHSSSELLEIASSHLLAGSIDDDAHHLISFVIRAYEDELAALRSAPIKTRRPNARTR